jgi:hypothetical protein
MAGIKSDKSKVSSGVLKGWAGWLTSSRVMYVKESAGSQQLEWVCMFFLIFPPNHKRLATPLQLRGNGQRIRFFSSFLNSKKEKKDGLKVEKRDGQRKIDG